MDLVASLVEGDIITPVEALHLEFHFELMN